MAMSLFFGYTFVMTACFFLLTGTVGYFSCQWFINVIYSSIKVRFDRSGSDFCWCPKQCCVSLSDLPKGTTAVVRSLGVTSYYFKTLFLLFSKQRDERARCPPPPSAQYFTAVGQVSDS